MAEKLNPNKFSCYTHHKLHPHLINCMDISTMLKKYLCSCSIMNIVEECLILLQICELKVYIYGIRYKKVYSSGAFYGCPFKQKRPFQFRSILLHLMVKVLQLQAAVGFVLTCIGGSLPSHN